MLRTNAALTLGILALVLSLEPTTAEAARVLAAELHVSGMDRSVPGRVTVQFAGHIKAIGPGRVHYEFLRSDGATGPDQIMDFGPGPASREVRTTWTLGHDYEGWQQLRIVHPPPLIESRRASFRAVVPPVARVIRAALSPLRSRIWAPSGAVDVGFRGQIAVNAPCTVTYRIVRSDGVEGPVASLAFGYPGSASFSAHWVVNHSMAGWAMIRVLTPNAFDSNRAAFSVQIGAGAPPP